MKTMSICSPLLLSVAASSFRAIANAPCTGANETEEKEAANQRTCRGSSSCRLRASRKRGDQQAKRGALHCPHAWRDWTITSSQPCGATMPAACSACGRAARLRAAPRIIAAKPAARMMFLTIGDMVDFLSDGLEHVRAEERLDLCAAAPAGKAPFD